VWCGAKGEARVRAPLSHQWGGVTIKKCLCPRARARACVGCAWGVRGRSTFLVITAPEPRSRWRPPIERRYCYLDLKSFIGSDFDQLGEGPEGFSIRLQSIAFVVAVVVVVVVVVMSLHFIMQG
jgi:hypothetical protein